MLWKLSSLTLLILEIGAVIAGVNDSNGETTGFTADELFAVIFAVVMGIVLVFGCVYYLYTRDHSIYDCGSYAVFKRCRGKSKNQFETDM